MATKKMGGGKIISAAMIPAQVAEEIVGIFRLEPLFTSALDDDAPGAWSSVLRVHTLRGERHWIARALGACRRDAIAAILGRDHDAGRIMGILPGAVDLLGVYRIRSQSLATTS